MYRHHPQPCPWLNLTEAHLFFHSLLRVASCWVFLYSFLHSFIYLCCCCLFLLELPTLGTARVTARRCVSTTVLTPVNIKAAHAHIDFMCCYKSNGLFGTTLAQESALYFDGESWGPWGGQEECFMGCFAPIKSPRGQSGHCVHTQQLGPQANANQGWD